MLKKLGMVPPRFGQIWLYVMYPDMKLYMFNHLLIFLATH